MGPVFKSLLRNYDAKEMELFLKANFVLKSACFIGAVFLISTLISHYTRPDAATLVTVKLTGLALILFSILLLWMGHYTKAVHTLLITCFATIWTCLFAEANQPSVANTDTIVYAIGLLPFIPFLFLKNRRPLILYSAGNILLFFAYIIFLKTTSLLGPGELLDYFFDNLFVLALITVVSFNVFAINRHAFNALETELERHKTARKRLFETNDKVLALVENAPIGIILWDLDFRVTEWSPSAQRLFGYSKEEAMGRKASELILPANVSMAGHPVFGDTASRPEGKRWVVENSTRDKGPVLCEWYKSPLKTIDGTTIGQVTLVNDITESEKARERLVQSEKMMVVGGLAAGMAHEINNPLAGITQNAQVARARLTREIPANQEAAAAVGTQMTAISAYSEKRGIINQLNRIIEAASHMGSITRNMLSFSRKPQSTQTLLNLETLMEETLELAKNDYNPQKGYTFKAIDIFREYTPGLPPVSGEKSKLQQVLLNLFKNASEVLLGHEIDGRSPALTLRLKQEADHVSIEIEDNGPGIDPEIAPHIFEPFFTTRRDGGTGLGLWISHHIIVESHSGQMDVESEPGKGTRFIIRLPLAAGEAQTSS